MLNKSMKTLLALSLSAGMISANVASVDAKELNTTGIQTEYKMMELDRHQAPVGVSQNLIQNGDFEKQGANWKFKNCNFSGYVHEGVQQGYKKSRWYAELPVRNNDAVVYQKMTLKRNTNYVLKAKVRVAVENAEVILAVKTNDLANKVAEKVITGVRDDWQYRDVELSFNSGDNTNVEIAVMKYTEQTSGPTYDAQVLVDNVELYERDTVGGMLVDGELNDSQQWTVKDASVDGTQGILNANSRDSAISQGVTIKANTDYVLNAKVKVELANASVFLAVKNANMGNLTPTTETTISATADTANQWQDIEFKFNSGNNTNVKIAFLKWLDNNQPNNPTQKSKMYIDSLSLRPENNGEIQPQDQYEVVWADEFNGKGTAIDQNGLDLSKWGYELGSIRGVEQQHYTKDRQNVRTEDGKLVLEVTNRDKDEQYKNPRGYRQVIYNSGSVRTHGKQEFLYGRIEVLAKIPESGKGVFPAFWTLGADFTMDGAINGAQGDPWPMSGEIDIMEAISNRNTVYQTLHYGDGPDKDNGKYAGNGTHHTITTPGVQVGGETYHVFGMDWSKGKIEWYVDDQIVRTVDYSDDPKAAVAIDRPQYIQLNFATGGNWPGDAGTDLAGRQFKIEYAYYAQNEKQKQQAKEYYDNTVGIQASDVTMVEGTTPDLLKDVSLTGEHQNGFTLDYSIDDEYLFTTNKDLTDNHPSNDQNQTKVVCRVGSKTQTDKLKALEPGEYNLHITAMHDSKVNVRKTVKLTITPKVQLADYTLVDEAIGKAEALNKDHYVDFSKVTDAINAVVRDLDITKQEQVNGYAKAINDAIKALVFKDADYTAVDEAIAKANALDKDLYKDFSAVTKAIEAVVRDLDITKQEQVNGYAKAINDAIDGLEAKVFVDMEKLVDFNKLTELLQKAKSIKSDNYTEESYKALTDMIDKAEKLYNSKPTQEQVDTMVKQLQNAIDGLEAKVFVDMEKLVDFNKLFALLQKAKSIKEDNYTQDSYKALTDMIDKAEKLYNSKPTQEQVDNMVKQLQNAIDGLKENNVPTTVPTSDTTAITATLLSMGLSALGLVFINRRRKEF